MHRRAVFYVDAYGITFLGTRVRLRLARMKKTRGEWKKRQETEPVAVETIVLLGVNALRDRS